MSDENQGKGVVIIGFILIVLFLRWLLEAADKSK